jgi:hypothetical protein
MAKTGHPNFVYTMNSAWRTGRHNWTLTGNHSGVAFDAADAATFMTGAASPFALSFAPFIGASGEGTTGGTWVQKVTYYGGSAAAPIYEHEYAAPADTPTALRPTGLAFTVPASFQDALETCVMMYAPVGFSSTNKPVFLRKYIHAVPTENVAAGGDGGVIWSFASSGTVAQAAATAMGNGSWFGTRVYISPSGAQPLSTDWAIDGSPSNHQMPRGRKRTVKSGGSSFALSAAKTLIGVGLGALADGALDL